MNTPIQTTRLEVSLNTDAYDAKYDIFKITTDENHFKHGAYILDAPTMCNKVSAVYFDSGRCFYVLMLKSENNKMLLMETIQDAEDGDKVTISSASSSEISKRAAVSLLLNALGSYSVEDLRFNNLTGHLYCYNVAWIKTKTKKGEKEIFQIPCLELAVSEDLSLMMAVRTFTSGRFKDKIEFKKKSYEKYPKYVYAANSTLRRNLGSDTENAYILRQIRHGRNTIPFMDMQNIEKFEASKMGVVEKVISLFDKKYDGVCHLSFKSVKEYISAESRKTLVKESKKTVKALLDETQINIVDMVRDEDSSDFCMKVQGAFKTIYDVEAKVSGTVLAECLNICVIHNAAYYDSGDDPYTKTYKGTPVQHITIEDFKENTKAAVETIAHEIIIKRDIKEGKLSLFDWSSAGIDEEVVFGIRKTEAQTNCYYFMKIRPDGSFEFKEQKPMLIAYNEYSEGVDALGDDKSIVGIIRYENGEINAIKETPWITIPEITKIRNELENGNTKLRSKERREELLSSVTDIKVFDEDGVKYYFVGIIGEGMRSVITNAANIRKIESYENATLRFEELLPLMNITFVRNGQLSVLPFPFKYLREYINGLELAQENE